MILVIFDHFIFKYIESKVSEARNLLEFVRWTHSIPIYEHIIVPRIR